MSTLRIEKVLTLPGTVSPSTLYIVKAAEAGLAEVYVTNSDGLETRHIISKQEILDLIAAAVQQQQTTTTTVSSSGYESSHVIVTSPKGLLGFSGYNNSLTAQWIQVFDATALPADGAAPVISVKAGAEDNFSWDSGTLAMDFANGIVICNSTTGDVKTLGAADCLFTVMHD